MGSKSVIDDLAAAPPFNGLSREELKSIAKVATVETFRRGDQVLDAFADGIHDVMVVCEGTVDLWHDPDHFGGLPDDTVGPGGVFGFSALLTERSVGPRAIAASKGRLVRVPSAQAAEVFSSPAGVRFVAKSLAIRRSGRADGVAAAKKAPDGTGATATVVQDVVSRVPILLPADTSIRDAARAITESGHGCAVVQLPDRYGMVTDASLRRRVLVDGVDPNSPVTEALAPDVATVRQDESLPTAIIGLLDKGGDYLLVTGPDGTLNGVASLRDFAVANTATEFAMHEQLRRATSVEELQSRARTLPTLLTDLLARGWASGKVISLYSTLVDNVIRRAIDLVIDGYPDLDDEHFTWLSLGSNGRREAVLSSDVDSAAVFSNDLPSEIIDRYRVMFAEVSDVLAGAGLSADRHGATTSNPNFSRTAQQWGEAAVSWVNDPVADKGAIMASLLVDGRPIYGDQGLPAVAGVFDNVRSHRGTMRMLLEEALSTRPKLPQSRSGFRRRPGTLDLKADAILPVVNIARWSALNSGSLVLATTERLLAARGSAMLPDDQSDRMIEVFNVLQLIRLRYQLLQHAGDQEPSDHLAVERISPIDRSVVTQCVKEIDALQRRMANISQFVPANEWAEPMPT